MCGDLPESSKSGAHSFTRKRKTKNPCPRCFLHHERCICALIPHIEVKTRLTLVIHAKELKRTTNTGRLAVQALVNSEMVVRGDSRLQTNLCTLVIPHHRSCIFFPAKDAIDIAEFVRQSSSSALPFHLIVPDGSWRQASKVMNRHPELLRLPRVKISDKNVGTTHLRREHRPEGLSTLEAIARAFAILEGTNIGSQLQDLYQAKLHATLAGRPKMRR